MFKGGNLSKNEEALVRIASQVSISTQIDETTSRKLKAIKALHDLKHIGKAVDAVVSMCADDFLSSPELRKDVSKRIHDDLEASRASFTKDGMSREDVLDLCGVSEDDIGKDPKL